MTDIEITIQTVLAFFGGLACIAGGVSAIVKLFSPFKSLQDKVNKHDKKLEDDFKRMNELEDSMKDIEESNKIICKSLFVLLNHEVTGNGVDKLKAQRDALEQFLIDK